MKPGAVFLLLLAMAGCAPVQSPVPASDQEALEAFRLSCTELKKRSADTMHGKGAYAAPVSAWLPACAAVARAKDAESFFAAYFTPVEAAQPGLVTGYFIPEVRGSLTKSAAYPVPVYRRPPEVKEGVPFFTRAEIEAGALAGRKLEEAWVSDRVALFFLQVQGSGVMVTEKGVRYSLVFDGKNHQPYTAIGKTLVERGELMKDKVSLFTIRDWLYAHPEQADAVMQSNASYIFLKRMAEKPARGASGATLTPWRSLAVDPAFIPYGMPVRIEGGVPEVGRFAARTLKQIMIAQDTGSAIKGEARGDIFFGSGAEAEQRAGTLNAPARFTLLIPKEVAAYAGL